MSGRRYSSWMLERLAIGDTVRLRVGTSTIGRHSSSNIRVLESNYVSRHHAVFNVAENDESVTITDVSSNGLFVNECRYDKTLVRLKDNDLIGFGLSPLNLEEDVDVTTLPIYKIKFSPIRLLQASNAKSKLPPTSNSETKPAAKVNGAERSSTNNAHNETPHNSREDNEQPSGSAGIKKEVTTNADEIFEISDDDEGGIVDQPALASNATNEELITSLNQHIDDVIKSEPSDDKDKLNSSQKYSENPANIVLPDNEDSSVEKSQNNVSNKKEEAEPSSSTTKASKEPVIHIPIISEVKKELLRSVSDDIKNIFGEIHDDIEIQKTIKQINPLVYNEISDAQGIKVTDDMEKVLRNGSVINLTEEEDLDEVEVEELGTIIPNITQNKEKTNTTIKDCKQALELSTIPSNSTSAEDKDSTSAEEKDSTAMERPKSPNIFDSSLDSSKEEQNIAKENKNNSENDKKKETTKFDENSMDFDEYSKYTPNSDDEDVEDLMFSQVLINDMKAELHDDLNSEENLPIPDQKHEEVALAGTTVKIKQEPGTELFSTIPKELENSCWIISDGEDYDEELETRVTDWSNKIFSQNLLSQSLSQVYELEETDTDDDSEENCYLDDYNFNFIEDDIDGIAEIYNRCEETAESTNETKEQVELLDEIIKSSQVQVNNLKQEQLALININDEKKEQLQTADVDPEIDITEKPQELDEKTPAAELPIIRRRRKGKRINETSSSSEDEPETSKLPKITIVPEIPISSEDEPEPETSKLPKITIVPEIPILRTHPPVIEAPSLPRHKGKLRGVSAALPKTTMLHPNSVAVNKTLKLRKEQLLQSFKALDMKRKWLEKPSINKKREKERKILIKECRKDKLKELAERKKSPVKNNAKRKLSSTEGSDQKAKVAKVKVTTNNRGAFLANNEQTLPPPATSAQNQKAEQNTQFKIPKLTKQVNKEKLPQNVPSATKGSPTRSRSMDCFETFSQQLSKSDEVLLKSSLVENKKSDKTQQNNNSKPLRRHSVTDSNLKQIVATYMERKKTPPPPSVPVCKESIAKRAVRTTNKITFASMEKNIVESEENKRKLSELSASSSNILKPINNANSNTNIARTKKTVRFNDTPVIHYIERITGACRKIDDKDTRTFMTTYVNRRHSVRSRFSIVDRTNEIISDILRWSNEWLKKRNAEADAASDLIYPMPSQFTSFEHYKSIIFPLMKLEFLSTLEREYNDTRPMKTFKVFLEHVALKEDRFILVTKFPNNQSKSAIDGSSYDLVILESDKRGPHIFAFAVANRKSAGPFSTIVYEVIAKNFTIEYFKAISEFHVRPVMDKARVHFGAFNSIYQLQSTPLFEKIINPLELLTSRPPPKRKVTYTGIDKLNEKQTQVLCNTYLKVIDEFTPNITLIQGPPGTGKSLVITNLVLQTLYGQDVRFLDKKILICAQSNAAVDVLALKFFNISMRMRKEKRFRLVRYGMLNKIHPSVVPVSLQKVVERDQLRKLQMRNNNINLENKENLKQQILQFEAEVAEMSSRNIRGTVEEDVLIEKKRQLQLMHNILNEHIRPEDERSLFTWYLTNANIICATLSSCVNLSQYMDYFDICIIDEATQCTEPWTLLPLKFGISSLVLVGDTQQLPATVLSKKANELGLGTSLFTRLQRCLDSVPSTSVRGVTTPNSIIYSLQTQYRMHPEICRWPNQYFYRNELMNATQTIDFNKSPLVPFCVLSLAYTQNNCSSSGKITNNLEAEFVAQLLKALDGFIPNRYNSYGVITPYAHHRSTLETALRTLGLTNIMVNTIDSYQGLEKDVIVISNARTSGIGFLSNPQRLNVALTRAKKCLILCGNFRNLESVPAWRSLLESARGRRLYHEISANSLEDIHRNVIDKIKLRTST